MQLAGLIVALLPGSEALGLEDDDDVPGDPLRSESDEEAEQADELEPELE